MSKVVSVYNKNKKLFSLDFEKKKKVIVFSPNGVGKSYISECFINKPSFMRTQKHGFRLKINSKNNWRPKTILFKEDDFKKHIISWQNLLKPHLKGSLKELYNLINKWNIYRLILAASFSNKGNYITIEEIEKDLFEKEEIHLLPSILHIGIKDLHLNYSKDRGKFNFFVDYFFDSKRIDKLKIIVNWYIDFLESFNKNDKVEKTVEDLQKHLKTHEKSYIEKIKEILWKTYMFNHFHLNKEMCMYNNMKDRLDNDCLLYYNSWDFMINIGRYYNFYNKSMRLIEKILESTEFSLFFLKKHKEKLESISNKLQDLKEEFCYSNWMNLEKYEKEEEELYKTFLAHLNKKNKNMYELDWLNEKPFSPLELIFDTPNCSLGERRLKIIKTYLDLYKDIEQDLIILDDPITNLDYFGVSSIVSWLRLTKIRPMFLILTRDFSFFSKLAYKEKESKTYILDKFNDDFVFTIELQNDDKLFFEKGIQIYWKQITDIDLDSIVLFINLIYENLRSYWKNSNDTNKMKALINSFFRHLYKTNKSKRKYKKQNSNKTIKLFIEKTQKLPCYFGMLRFINELLKWYEKQNNSENEIHECNLDMYILYWETNELDKYREKIVKGSLTLLEYFTMKFMLVICCRFKIEKLEYEIQELKNKKKEGNTHLNDVENKNIKNINDQINGLIHFETFRLFSLFEISCEALIQHVNFVDREIKSLKKHKKVPS